MSVEAIQRSRLELQRRLFPRGVPQLWCPTITHYRDDGSIDAERMRSHLSHLAPHVKGILAPGSTGDGWELNDAESDQLIEVVRMAAKELGLNLLVGALKHDASSAATRIRAVSRRLLEIEGGHDPIRALAQGAVIGFTVCPSTGRDLSQETIGQGLVEVLKTGQPIALYQLPQVTENEMAPALFSGLVDRFSNLIFFKDTSGADRIALSGADPRGVFMVRGAEGEYARWLKSNGGPYDGFLLSTANCFAAELHTICEMAAAGKLEAANELSGRVSAVVATVFDLVKTIPQGNAFANSNKAMDHFFAYGKKALRARSPMLHAGVRLTMDLLRTVEGVLSQSGFLKTVGYLG